MTVQIVTIKCIADKTIEDFIDLLRQWARECRKKKQTHRFLIISKEDRKDLLKSSDICCICKENITEKKVIHHCHVTGNIFGVAHNACNMKVKTQNFLPVFFHNLSGYDAHHIIRKIKLLPEEKLTVVPTTYETYISFSLLIPCGKYTDRNDVEKSLYEEIRFLDSFRFQSSGLASLVGDLTHDDFKNVYAGFHDYPSEKLQMLKSKGVYPYSYLDTFEKFEMKHLPPLGEDWRNSLSDEIDVTAKEIEFANSPA